MASKFGKEISSSLLARSYGWKEKVHEKNRKHALRLLEDGNHQVIDSCLICGNLTREYMSVDQVPYGHCEVCNHLQSSIRPTTYFLETLYGSGDESYSSQDLAYVELSESEFAQRVEQIAKPKVEWIVNNISLNENNLWVDIGSGTGDILSQARIAGFDILGIEASPSEISIAESRKIPTKRMFFDGTQSLDQLSQAKVVSLFNVLEHTLNPLKFLESISRQMRIGSYLVIEVPKFDSFTTLVQRADSTHLYRHIFSPEHLNIFSTTSILQCLDLLALKRESVWYFGSDAIEIFGRILGLVNPDKNENLEKFEFEINNLQKQIDCAGLSDVMLLIAKKC